MCTLSVVARENGYLLGMNRDERIERGAGCGPEAREIDGTRVIYPTDGEGGTWIGVNEQGIALALLNWNEFPVAVNTPKRRSRGLLIAAVLASRSLGELRAQIEVFHFEGMSPFRLIAICPAESQTCEWRWNPAGMDSLSHGWQVRHWFSSSLSDREAESLRGAACRAAWKDPDAGSASWLRKLHASHVDVPGPFSLCVHRPDVRTLSYTEIECWSAEIRMEHFVCSPCVAMAGHSTELVWKRRLDVGQGMAADN
jgi:hypothetical protein